MYETVTHWPDTRVGVSLGGGKYGWARGLDGLFFDGIGLTMVESKKSEFDQGWKRKVGKT